MGNINQTRRVKHAVLNTPQLIPMYFEEPFNKQITKTVLNKMVNRRIGIEIECFGSLYSSSLEEIKRRDGSTSYTGLREADMIDMYGILAYGEDNYPGHCDYSLHYLERPSYIDNEGFNEHKISIKDWSQLTGLYSILEDMKQICRLNNGSGIHIHIDLNNEFKEYGNSSFRLARLFDKHLDLDKVEQIFYPNSHYDAHYNSDKQVGEGKGHNWVGIRSGYNTIEFRIAPMSFEYTEIVRWIVECTKLVNHICDKYIWCKKENKQKISNNQQFKLLINAINNAEYSEEWREEFVDKLANNELISHRIKYKAIKHLERKRENHDFCTRLARRRQRAIEERIIAAANECIDISEASSASSYHQSVRVVGRIQL